MATRKKSRKSAKKSSVFKKKMSKKMSKKIRKFFVCLLGGILALCVILFGVRSLMNDDFDDKEFESGDKPVVCERVEENYGHMIDSCAHLVGLPSAYFKSLACLECSGRTDMPKRFEKHVYKRLKNVREGKLQSYEGVTQSMLKDASDDALKNLATSWGPFQIMGYKCLHLSINVADLRGKDAVYWGIKWVYGEYGHLLKRGRYRDAFHYHNTGRIFPSDGKPTTYNKNYVPQGLEYMRLFEFEKLLAK